MTLVQRIFNQGWQSVCNLGASLFALFAPATPAVLTAFTFIVMDMHYGYKVSKKFGKVQFESNKFWKTVNKFAEATMIICGALLLDKYIFMTYENLSAVRIAAGSICFAETLSLLESLRALHPNAWLSKILSKVIKSKAEKYLDIELPELKEPNDTNIDSSKK